MRLSSSPIHLATILLALLAAAAVAGGCSELADEAELPTIDPGGAPPIAPTPRIPEPGRRVEIELSEYLQPAAEGSATVFQVERPEELIEGDVARGKVGDYILQNDRVRFLIEGDDRAMSPCPFGGTVLDAEYLGAQGDAPTGDITGEVCLFLNGGQTLKPERFEILSSGGPGQAAVLAVTGRLTVSDFINLKGMVDDFVNGFSDRIDLEPDEILGLRVTVYYLLEPGAQGLQVITALRNDGAEQADLIYVHLVASGGDGRYFNPASATGGYGSGGGAELLGSEDLPFLGFVGEEASYLFVPEPVERLGETAGLPFGGTYLTVAGVAAAAWNTDDLLSTVLVSESKMAEDERFVHLAPGESRAIRHWFFAGDGALSTTLDPAYEAIGVETGQLSGRVEIAGGADGEEGGLAGLRVSAVRAGEGRGRTMNQTLTDASGRWSMRLPAGSYELIARGEGMPTSSAVEVEVSAGSDAEAPAPILVSAPGILRLQVRTPAGASTPARVTVICPTGSCPDAPTALEEDVTFHSKPSNFAAIGYAGIDGTAEVRVPPGDYEIVVSRGLEWSVWPYDAVSTGAGRAVSLEAGVPVALEAEIAHVVDSTGAISGDFHVHGVASPDSPVPGVDRVRGFLSEGVDVIVSTDHDVITDYAASIEAVGAGDELASIVGEEVTTSDLGHFNAFPIVRDLEHRRGGAIDWGGGEGPGLVPSEIFAALRAFPGEQVVQVNHPGSLGYFNSADIDVLRGLSFAERGRKRLPEAEADEETGDTGLWSEEFTAIEVMNGPGVTGFYGVGRWWLTMVGRGFSPTATAVTDTHKLYSHLGGIPRTFALLAEEHATAASFDEEAFVSAVNGGEAFGTTGPFLRVSVSNESADAAGLGEVLATGGAAVEAEVSIQVPEWMRVDTVEVYQNLPLEALLTEPGEALTEPFAPTLSSSFELGEADLEVVAEGEATHRRYRKVVNLTLDGDEDAYVVFVVRQSGEGGSMFPIHPNRELKPFAFTNPVYLDADGGGYDAPPYLEASKSPPSQARSLPLEERGDHVGHDHPADGRERILRKMRSGEAVDRDDLRVLLGALRCKH